MPDTVNTAFELIRREGLIIVAIGALAWQVYWLTTTSAEQDRLWREEIAEYRKEVAERAKYLIDSTAAIAQAMQKMNERIATVEKIMSDMEEECQIWTVKKQLETHTDE